MRALEIQVDDAAETVGIAMQEYVRARYGRPLHPDEFADMYNGWRDKVEELFEAAAQGRGRAPHWDELMVAEIGRLRADNARLRLAFEDALIAKRDLVLRMCGLFPDDSEPMPGERG